jgi:DNA-directed RNA polymerase specialized sigma24 family protein
MTVPYSPAIAVVSPATGILGNRTEVNMEPVAPDTQFLLSRWVPLLLRFFHLLTGAPELAESLTIETLVEHLKSPSLKTRDNTVAVLRCALTVLHRVAAPASRSTDPLVHSLLELSPEQRTVVVLVGAFSLSVPRVSEITGLQNREVKHICQEALRNLSFGLRQFDKEPQRIPASG